METVALLNPAFLLSAGATAVTFIGWLIRLESKANNSTAETIRLADMLARFSSESKDHRRQIEDELYKHLLDPHLHYNEQAMQEFRTALDLRFTTLENTLRLIEQKLDKFNAGH